MINIRDMWTGNVKEIATDWSRILLSRGEYKILVVCDIDTRVICPITFTLPGSRPNEF